MDPDDHHYYCCGECQGLFPTLSSLSKHKKICTGSKDLSALDRYYAYHCSYLIKLFKCCTSCQHSESCPILTSRSDEAQEKTSNASSKIRGRRTRRAPKNRTKMTESDANAKQRLGPSQPKRRRTKTEKNNINVQEDIEKTEITEKDMHSSQTVNNIHVLESEKDGCVSIKPEGAIERKTIAEEISRIEAGTGTVSREIEQSESQISDRQAIRQDANLNAPDDKRTNDITSQGKSPEESAADDSTCDTNPSTDVDALLKIMTKYKQNPQVNDGSDTPCFQCPVCDWKTVHLGFFARHINSHSDQAVKGDWRCRKCDFKCSDPSELKLHIGDNHAVKLSKGKLKPKVSDNDANGHTAESMKKYQVTIPAQGGKNCTFYKCAVCGWKSAHIGFFGRHLRTHNGTEPNSKWTCNECDFECVTTSELKLHAKKHRRTFMCEYCSRRFSTKQELSRHVNLHTGEKPYKCTQCDYKCRQPKNLTEHKRKHTGEKLKCEVEGCTFTTFYSWALKGHVACKHETTKRFSCPECPYQTSDCGSMVRHKRLHAGEKNYKCSQCNFRAVAKHDIVKHMRTHTKEKVYFCDQCNFGTSHSSCLRLHIMNHLGVKPWQCVLCGYNSITRGKVIRHLKQTHQGHNPLNINEAVVNLGLKLDINVSDYRRAKSSGEKVIYDVQEVTDFDNLEQVEVIVEEVDEEKLLQLTTNRETVHQLSHMPAIRFQQLSNNSQDSIEAISTEAKTIIIPMTNADVEIENDAMVTEQAIGGAETHSSNNEMGGAISEGADVSQQGTVLFTSDNIEFLQDQTVTFVTKPPDSSRNSTARLAPFEPPHIGTIEEVVGGPESGTVLQDGSDMVACTDDQNQHIENTHETIIYTGELSHEAVLLDGQEVEVVWHLNAEETV